MGLYNKNYSGKDDLVDAASMLFSVVETFSYRYWQNPLGIIKRGYMAFEKLFDLNKPAIKSYAERFEV